MSTTEVSHHEVEDHARSSDMLWIFVRAFNQKSTTHQKTPSWAGWVSLTGGDDNASNKQSTVEFLAPIFASVTEFATVQHILKLSQAASREVNQMYTFVTFDLAVVMKALPIVWEKSDAFKDVIV